VRQQKRRKRKEGQGKRKEKWQNDRARTMFHKITGNIGKNAGNRRHNIIFFPLWVNIILMVALKRKKGQGKRKEKWQNDRARTMFYKIIGNLGKKCRQ
jgi:hypothetical protein